MKNAPKILLTAYLIMWVVIFILPFYSVASYSIIRNTTSQLGAQQTPNAWIMNITFILLGVGSILSGWNYLKGYWFHKALLTLFGFCLVLTAFFHHAPVDISLTYDIREDELHSLFASLTGFAFTIFAISTGFIVQRKADMVVAIGVGILASALSALMFKIPEFMGIWQRMIFVMSFGWMTFLFWKRDNQ